MVTVILSVLLADESVTIDGNFATVVVVRLVVQPSHWSSTGRWRRRWRTKPASSPVPSQ